MIHVVAFVLGIFVGFISKLFVKSENRDYYLTELLGGLFFLIVSLYFKDKFLILLPLLSTLFVIAKYDITIKAYPIKGYIFIPLSLTITILLDEYFEYDIFEINRGYFFLAFFFSATYGFIEIIRQMLIAITNKEYFGDGDALIIATLSVMIPKEFNLFATMILLWNTSAVALSVVLLKLLLKKWKKETIPLIPYLLVGYLISLFTTDYLLDLLLTDCSTSL